MNYRINSFKLDPKNHYRVTIIKKKRNYSFIKTTISILSYSLFIWLLLIGVTLLVYVADVNIRKSKGDFSSPKYNAYVVLTGSMLPKVKVGDVVITKKVSTIELRVGDIITFYSSNPKYLGTVITHRIIGISDNNGQYKYITKGDNNNVEDETPAIYENIIGKVMFKIPKIGYIQNILAISGGWLVVILVPALAIVSYDIMKLLRKFIRKNQLRSR